MRESAALFFQDYSNKCMNLTWTGDHGTWDKIQKEISAIFSNFIVAAQNCTGHNLTSKFSDCYPSDGESVSNVPDLQGFWEKDFNLTLANNITNTASNECPSIESAASMYIAIGFASLIVLGLVCALINECRKCSKAQQSTRENDPLLRSS